MIKNLNRLWSLLTMVEYKWLKLILLLVFLITLINSIIARGGFTFSTYLNKPSSRDNPAEYYLGDTLELNYKLENKGLKFFRSVCFFLKDPRNNIHDITSFIERRINIQHYNCDSLVSECPINLENIGIDTTTGETSGNMITYPFLPTSELLEGNYELTVNLRKEDTPCSKNGIILGVNPSVDSINYFRYKKTNQVFEGYCPINNVEFTGCHSTAPVNSEINSNYRCQSPNLDCYQCSPGYLFSNTLNRCTFEGELPNDCLILKEKKPRYSKLNIVLVGDNYGSNMALFLNDVSLVKERILALEPFKELNDKINFYAINSEESMECRANCPPGTVLTCCNKYKIKSLVSQKCPYNYIIVLFNSNIFGGFGGDNFEQFSEGVSIVNHDTINFNPNAGAHEFGHSFGGLVDEYTGPSASDSTPDPERYVANDINCDSNSQCTKWQDLKGERRVGCFEGCKRVINGVYRPIRANTIMFDMSGDFGPVNEKHLKKLLERYE